MKCLCCGIVDAVKGGKFCSRSCSATNSNRTSPKRADVRPEAACINCSTIFKYRPSAQNGKFCSNACTAEHKIKQTRERVLAGENVGSAGVRELLIETFGEICAGCGVGAIWKDKPLTLHVDHIDGNSDNNNWKNCQLLCPNCHSQTPTFGFNGIKKFTKRNLSKRKIPAQTAT
jgi:hypothetical protein